MINQMGRIVTNVKIKNLLHPEVSLSSMRWLILEQRTLCCPWPGKSGSGK